MRYAVHKELTNGQDCQRACATLDDAEIHYAAALADPRVCVVSLIDYEADSRVVKTSEAAEQMEAGR